jgi:2,3,4,5-tetrahydropyridine-2-carboxylate N-succinyltransferase
MADLKASIEALWARRSELSPADTDAAAVVDEAIELLDSGQARVAEVDAATDQVVVHEWLKKSILLLFTLRGMATIEHGPFEYADKLPLKRNFAAAGVRVVPGASARWGSFLARGVILMPSYVNIGGWVGEGTMVDTWATVGSCAQIGAKVHLSGGVGIGGVLEPLQASPTIIEDDCFIGARSEIVEGVIVERGAVISMGVFIGASTPIYDRRNGEISYGRVPAGAVVVAGSLPREGGRYNLNCAVIVKQVDAQTRAKVGINELLRPD